LACGAIDTKADVLNRAVANGIREETRRLGEGYFRSLFAGLAQQEHLRIPATFFDVFTNTPD